MKKLHVLNQGYNSNRTEDCYSVLNFRIKELVESIDFTNLKDKKINTLNNIEKSYIQYYLADLYADNRDNIDLLKLVNNFNYIKHYSNFEIIKVTKKILKNN